MSTPSTFSPEQWAKITIQRWEYNITTLSIVNSRQLLNSFTQQVIKDANGDVSLIRFTFQYYGRMVEMGVGKGTTISEVESSRRNPKPWYNKAFAHEVKRLAELLAEHHGRVAVTIIKESIEG